MRYFLMLVMMVLISTTEGMAQSSSQLPRQLITLENSCQLELIEEIDGEGATLNFVQDMDFNVSGNYLGYTSNNEFVIWDVSNSQAMWKFPVFNGSSVIFGSESQVGLIANQSIYFWRDISDINFWEELKLDDGRRFSGAGDLHISLDDGTLIALRQGTLGLAKWSLDDSKLLYQMTEEPADEFTYVRDTIISPDAQVAVAIKNSEGVFFIDTTDNTIIAHLNSITTRPSWLRLLTFTNDSENPYLLINEQNEKQNESGLFISKLLVIDLSGEIVSTYEYDFEVVWTQADFNPVNNLLVLANAIDGKLYFYGEDYSETVCTLDSLEPDMVTALAFSPDGTLLASGGQDGTLRLWGIPAGE